MEANPWPACVVEAGEGELEEKKEKKKHSRIQGLGALVVFHGGLVALGTVKP